MKKHTGHLILEKIVPAEDQRKKMILEIDEYLLHRGTEYIYQELKNSFWLT